MKSLNHRRARFSWGGMKDTRWLSITLPNLGGGPPLTLPVVRTQLVCMPVFLFSRPAGRGFMARLPRGALKITFHNLCDEVTMRPRIWENCVLIKQQDVPDNGGK